MRIFEITDFANPVETESSLQRDLDGVDLSSFDAFIASLRKVPKEQVVRLQNVLNDLNNKKHQPTGNYIELYHGAPEKAANDIKKNGFKITHGQRSIGFLGGNETVDNHGIFLTDDKPMAHFFGSNRSDFGNNYEMFTCYVDASKILDSDHVPRPLIRFGLKLINEYNGSNIKKIPMREWWWLLDRKEFVDAIKSFGYTGVKFPEAKAIQRTAKSSGNTYLIFNASSIIIKGKDTMKINDFYDWLVKQKHLTRDNF